jgi:hypothetical protein
VQKRHNDKEALKGMYNEDEAPDEEGSQIAAVMDGGRERLDIISTFAEKLSATTKSKTSVQKQLSKERRQAADDILNLAHLAKVRSGKVWSLAH